MVCGIFCFIIFIVINNICWFYWLINWEVFNCLELEVGICCVKLIVVI